MTQAEIHPAKPGVTDHGAGHREVAREGGWAGIINLLGAAIRYGNQILLTRLLGAKLYGLYALANQVVTVATVAAGLGLPISVVHFVASGASAGRWGKLRWVVRVALAASLLSGLVGMVAVLALSPWASEAIFHKKQLRTALMGLGLALPFLVLYMVCAGGLQGLKKIRAKVFIERIAHPLLFSAILLMGWLFFRKDPLPFVLGGYVVAAVAVLVMAGLWLRRELAALPKAEGREPAHWRALFSFSTPVMFMNLLQQFVLRSDALVMGVFRVAAEVGIYVNAATLALGVSMPTDAMGASLAPSFSALVAQGDTNGLRRLFHTSTRWLFLLAGAVGLGLILSGELILRLFGKDFRAGFPVLCILAVGQMFAAALGASGTLITFTGHPKVNLINSLCMGLGNLGLMLLLVPRYGAIGAASAAALSMVILNLARMIEIWFILKIGPWDRTILKPMVVVTVAALLGGAAFYAFGPWVATPVGLGTFAVAWWGLKPEAEDADMLRRAWAKLRRSPP
jgi:O-antigen/teichoic acid export membrane protein